jgi:hypothetical protein
MGILSLDSRIERGQQKAGAGFASDRALVIKGRMISFAKPLSLWRIMR